MAALQIWRRQCETAEQKYESDRCLKHGEVEKLKLRVGHKDTRGHTGEGLSLATSKARNLRTPSEDLTENTDQKGKEIP